MIFAYCPKISDDYTNMQSDIMPLNSIIDNVWLHKFSKGKRKDNYSKLFASTLHCHYTDGFDMYLEIWSGLTLRGPVFVEYVE